MCRGAPKRASDDGRADRLRSLGVFAALTLLAFWLCGAREGLLDWDSYARFFFLSEYRPDLYHDTHQLYHRLLLLMRGMGLPLLVAERLLTASSYAAFLTLLWRIGRREGLSLRGLAFVLVLASLGSPGLLALLLSFEDNVAYFPFLVLFYYNLMRSASTRHDNLRYGVFAGLALALGLLINVTLLIFLFAGASLPLLLALRLRAQASRLALTLATALLVYYVVYLTILHGSRVALHEVLPQALQLRDFQQSDTPLLSFARLEQYLGGMRAIALAPTVHFMQLPRWLRSPLLTFLPLALFALYLAAALLIARHREPRSREVERPLLVPALFALALAFPFFYEPALIERWDIVYVGVVLLIVRSLGRPQLPLLRSVLALMLLVQCAGGVLVLTNHYGLTYVDPALENTRKLAARARREGLRLLVLPNTTRRPYLAFLRHHTPGVLIYLAWREGGQLRVRMLVGLREVEMPASALRSRVLRGTRAFFDPRLDPWIVGALGGQRSS
ncbi:MAG: hypothetical protein CSA65_09310 [Proteobacteria bacterium]|nr:MAG: hypothetical protein CSA65_09310 [Pseudomonadota bacterium]